MNIHEQANCAIQDQAQLLFGLAIIMMEEHNEGLVIGNPFAIVEELNVNLPWMVDDLNIKYEESGGQIIALFDNESF